MKLTIHTRVIFLSAAALLLGLVSHAQVSLKMINLNYGLWPVGFKHEVADDSTRTYKRMGDWNNTSMPRPITVSIWYPAKRTATNQSPMNVLNYMQIFKEEEEWENLPDDRILDWFSYSNTPDNRSHLTENCKAYRNLPPAPQTFPVVIYAPSFQASSIENFVLCEYLASQGYVVISSPSRGTETRQMEAGTEKDMETQARDIEFLIGRCGRYPFVDREKIATMGFSFGGLSNVLSQMQNTAIKAIVSLDGTIRYQYPVLKKSAYADIERVNVPFLHLAQKDIPASVLAEDKLDASLNDAFVFYDDLVYSEAYSLKCHDMTHSYFSTLGVLFQSRDPRQDKSDREIMTSYRWVSIYALQFLDAYLKGDKKALTFINNSPTANGIPEGLISYRHKAPKKEALNFEDFNKMAAGVQYAGLSALYDSVLIHHPSFKPKEWQLNNLGLQLLFNSKNIQNGVRVLELATKLYPGSANLFDSLGEAYMFTSQNDLAKKAFKTSLSLDSANTNAAQRLKQLH
ncbi:Dienelactone hydrolase [Chitinophaga sp. YR627]|uniref:dienelactone hydrolase family protein n=1 Tax=Chitinophaga sp. YR627 TaxID=1881041 RepID=UPI0008EB9826|nr:dienelactone hydrolase family protein [Chitinophaga sp. YR627]SFO02632.1 Dienelactone hydrolase [Chitinophaga sp. YR627]